MVRGAKNIEKKNKIDRRRTLKNENKVKQKIQGKSNNKHVGFTFFEKRIYFALKHISKR